MVWLLILTLLVLQTTIDSIIIHNIASHFLILLRLREQGVQGVIHDECAYHQPRDQVRQLYFLGEAVPVGEITSASSIPSHHLPILLLHLEQQFARLFIVVTEIDTFDVQSDGEHQHYQISYDCSIEFQYGHEPNLQEVDGQLNAKHRKEE